MRGFFDNPVVLRELGWAYYPKVLRRFPRLPFQVGAVLAILLLSAWAVAYFEVRHRFGHVLLIIEGVLAGALLPARWIPTGLNAWNQDRDLRLAEELVLTGMTPRDFAAARVFARGFPLLLGSVLAAIVFVAGVIWTFLAESSTPHPIHGEDRRALFILCCAAAIHPILAFDLYLRVLGVGLRRGHLAMRGGLAVLGWLAVRFGPVFLFAALMIGFAEMTSGFNDVTVPFARFAVLLVPGYALTCYVSYQRLLGRIGAEYLSAVD
ncbi:hypothetical protein HZA57_06490 [Candidatus Poribacteria bacterium]|nr:hypothetical protein [Candidatus Poribacteria bacterium]